MTRLGEIPRWECTGRRCNWEYLDSYAAEHGHRCTTCGARLGRKPTQASIFVAVLVNDQRLGHVVPHLTDKLKHQAADNEFAAVGDMERAGWKRGEARQWYRRRAKSHAGVPT
jgi:hypothetical protein